VTCCCLSTHGAAPAQRHRVRQTRNRQMLIEGQDPRVGGSCKKVLLASYGSVSSTLVLNIRFGSHAVPS
jgi:hypothetical protein